MKSWKNMPLAKQLNADLVPMAGVEPARLSPLPPQDSVSTNSTTSAGNLLRTTATTLLIIQVNHFSRALPAARVQAPEHREHLPRSPRFPSPRQALPGIGLLLLQRLNNRAGLLGFLLLNCLLFYLIGKRIRRFFRCHESGERQSADS